MPTVLVVRIAVKCLSRINHMFLINRGGQA